mgnify:CR=1 FL=1
MFVAHSLSSSSSIKSLCAASIASCVDLHGIQSFSIKQIRAFHCWTRNQRLVTRFLSMKNCLEMFRLWLAWDRLGRTNNVTQTNLLHDGESFMLHIVFTNHLHFAANVEFPVALGSICANWNCIWWQDAMRQTTNKQTKKNDATNLQGNSKVLSWGPSVAIVAGAAFVGSGVGCGDGNGSSRFSNSNEKSPRPWNVSSLFAWTNKGGFDLACLDFCCCVGRSCSLACNRCSVPARPNLTEMHEILVLVIRKFSPPGNLVDNRNSLFVQDKIHFFPVLPACVDIFPVFGNLAVTKLRNAVCSCQNLFQTTSWVRIFNREKHLLLLKWINTSWVGAHGVLWTKLTARASNRLTRQCTRGSCNQRRSNRVVFFSWDAAVPWGTTDVAAALTRLATWWTTTTLTYFPCLWSSVANTPVGPSRPPGI